MNVDLQIHVVIIVREDGVIAICMLKIIQVQEQEDRIMMEDEEFYWVCSTCGTEFNVEGNGRVHVSLQNHGVLYMRIRKIKEEMNPSRR